MSKTILDANFVRREWYIQPPEKGASPDMWATWLKADRQAAAAHKRAHTKAQAHAELPDVGKARAMVKIGGVWRQSALMGLVGSADDGSLGIEPAVDANQERDLIQARQAQDQPARGSKSKARRERQARNRRETKRRKLGFN